MEEEDLINLIVVERMGWHFKQFRKTHPREGKGALENPDALRRLQEMATQLQPELVPALNACIDEMVHLIAADDERYYRAGVEDGIRLEQFVKQMKEKQE